MMSLCAFSEIKESYRSVWKQLLYISSGRFVFRFANVLCSLLLPLIIVSLTTYLISASSMPRFTSVVETKRLTLQNRLGRACAHISISANDRVGLQIGKRIEFNIKKSGVAGLHFLDRVGTKRLAVGTARLGNQTFPAMFCLTREELPCFTLSTHPFKGPIFVFLDKNDVNRFCVGTSSQSLPVLSLATPEGDGRVLLTLGPDDVATLGVRGPDLVDEFQIEFSIDGVADLGVQRRPAYIGLNLTPNGSPSLVLLPGAEAKRP